MMSTDSDVQASPMLQLPSPVRTMRSLPGGGSCLSGPGIAPGDRERALDRFVRLDPSRHLPGNGLGLALAAAAARRHNARLVLADAAPGEDPPGLRASLEFAAP